MDKKDPSQPITITGADLIEAIKALRPEPPPDTTGLGPERKAVVYAPQVQRRWRLIPCVSPFTGATFDAKVIESAVHPEGRIVELHNYKHPIGIYKTIANGGLTSDGVQIFRSDVAWSGSEEEPPKRALTPYFLQNRYEQFFKRDLLTIVGGGGRRDGAMLASYCKSPDGLKTPWMTGAAVAA